MALTKEIVLDKIEILRNGIVLARYSIEVYEDAEFIGNRFRREVFTPDMALNTIQDNKVRAICNLVWTPAVIAAYIASIQTSRS